MTTAPQALASGGTPRLRASLLPPFPLSVWMFLGAVVVVLAAGRSNTEVVSLVNEGYGRALGDFALLLLPSFLVAGALSRRRIGGTGRFAAGLSPLVGAGMICPDTAYAALAPVSGRYRLQMAAGAYAGFKLLPPAGPLIVGTGLGLAMSGAFLWGILLLPVVWGAGLLALAVLGRSGPSADACGPDASREVDWATLAPFALLAALLVLGAATPLGRLPVADFFLNPRGALLAASFLAVALTPAADRRDVIQSAVRRTAALLFVIGAAGAFGMAVTTIVPVVSYWPVEAGPAAALVALFAGAALFKLLQGSSMATFAAVTAVAGPLVAASGLPPVAAVYAICLGTVVAVTPNDSFYWLVRTDALDREGEARCLAILAGTTLVQGLAGFLVLLGLLLAGVI